MKLTVNLIIASAIVLLFWATVITIRTIKDEIALRKEIARKNRF